ncbi:hypothetical protein D3C76_974160 [compost metagenome]
MLGERPGDRGHTYVSHHLDRERSTQDGAGLRAGQIVGQQPKRHRRQAGADQGDHLSNKQVPVSAVFQDGKHGTSVHG